MTRLLSDRPPEDGDLDLEAFFLGVVFFPDLPLDLEPLVGDVVLLGDVFAGLGLLDLSTGGIPVLVKLTRAWKVLSDILCPPSCFLSPSTFKRNLL